MPKEIFNAKMQRTQSVNASKPIFPNVLYVVKCLLIAFDPQPSQNGNTHKKPLSVKPIENRKLPIKHVQMNR